MEQIRRENNFNVPNVLTAVRIGLLPAIVWRFRRGDSAGALLLYLIAMLTDAVDGLIARRFGLITTLGKLLDPIADKLSLLTLIGLFVAEGQIPGWVLGVILMKELCLVIGSAFALHRGIVVYALPIGKVTTVTFILSIVLRFLDRKAAADALLGASLALSMAALIWYTREVLKKLRAQRVCKA